MPHTIVNPHALILTPVGRDAEVAQGLLKEVGIASDAVGDLPTLIAALSESTLLVIVTEEAFGTADLRTLTGWLRDQPSWSDLPFVLLTRHGGGPERNPGAARISEALGNVVFIERPFHPTTFVSVVRTAHRGRRRQYESRSTLEALRESGEKLRTALVAGRLGAWELDVAPQRLTGSDAFNAVFGRAADKEFSYGDLLGSVHSDDLGLMLANLRRTIDKGEDHVGEYRILWPDGSVHWAELRARLTRSAAGARLVGVSADITARKEAEDALRNENEQLEARVIARTQELEEAHRTALAQVAQRELAEAKLRQSQKLEMIGQLTGGVAHDFNNLLMAVLGNLDLLKKRMSPDSREMRLIDGALQGARRGATLTQRLLAFARRQELSLEVADLVELVRGMEPLIERTIGATIELQFRLPNHPVHCELDVNQVELALLNLVVNARDAMPEGGQLTLRIDDAERRFGGFADAPAFVRLIVTDTGHGMDKHTLDRAIEPFFSTKGVGKGTGLGLSMIQGLAQQLGGEFRLSSEVGKGTTAELSLPTTEREAEAGGPSPEAAAPNGNEQKLRILFVDDDALIAMATVGMLEDLGHEVFEANSGDAALKLLEAGERIDLMITDFSMPRMNGAQLAKAARDLRPELAIVLATGFAELPPGMEIELPRLAKPYGQDALETEIEKIMAVRKVV